MRIINDKTKNPKLVYPTKDIRSIILASLPVYRSKIGNKGSILSKKIKKYTQLRYVGEIPKAGNVLIATYP
jgi:hypothetical protein